MKKTVSLLIAATMLLTACSNSVDGKKKTKISRVDKHVEEDDHEENEEVVKRKDNDPDDSDIETVSTEVGERITFGSYPQGADGTVKPIEWQVLDVQDGMALLISVYGLDAKPYNEYRIEDVSWETCTLRAWLNNDFMNTAFTEEEKTQIAKTTVINEYNPISGADSGNDTEDQMFLLSLEEVQEYFDLDMIDNGETYCAGDSCCCTPTEYAAFMGAYVYEAKKAKNENYNGNTGWWLRSPGFDDSIAAHVTAVGYCTGSAEVHPDSREGAVRPSMWIDLTGKGRDRIRIQDLSEVVKGDVITLGTYPQDENGSVRPIKWQVLEVKDGKALIISEYGLDCKPYNTEETDVTWETCTLRAWLNQDFMNTAFTPSEQGLIAETKLVNEDNPMYGTKGGNDTTDKVFLLSLNEVLEYFDLTLNNGQEDSEVYCFGEGSGAFPTEYCVKQGLTRVYATCRWWLRSPGQTNTMAACSLGRRTGPGFFVNNDGAGAKYGVAVRPAMWITLG